MKLLVVALTIFVCNMHLGQTARAEALRAENCTITALDFSDTSFHLSFTGRWTVLKESALMFADTDKNGLVVIRDRDADAAAWKALCDTAQHAFASRSAVTITSNALAAMRGGIVIFKTPPDRIKIIPQAPH